MLNKKPARTQELSWCSPDIHTDGRTWQIQNFGFLLQYNFSLWKFRVVFRFQYLAWRRGKLVFWQILSPTSPHNPTGVSTLAITFLSTKLDRESYQISYSSNTYHMASLNEVIVKSLLLGSDISSISSQIARFLNSESTTFLGIFFTSIICLSLEVFPYDSSKLIP